MTRNRWIWIRPGDLGVKVMAAAGSCDVAGGRHHAAAWWVKAGPSGKPIEKTGILT